MGIKTFIYVALIFQLANAGCPFSSKNEEEPKEMPKAKDDIADPETTTPNGCTCTSLCGASADDLFRVSFVKDLCHGLTSYSDLIG